MLKGARLWLAAFVLVAVAGQAAVGMRASRTARITGDEPFYVATAQSLVSDHDLDLRDEYARGGAEMASWWDGRVPLWRQMEPASGGRLLAPHDPGLPLLVAPAFALAGVAGVERFLVLVWALAMGLAAVLARRAGAPAWAALVGAVAVGAGPPGLVYASQIYPEAAAAACVAGGLVVATGRRPRAAALVATVVALEWLGVKYLPLALLVVGLWAWRFRAERRALAGAAAAFAVAGAHFVWWHLHTFGGLTPYSTNVVWAGEGTAQIVRAHVSVPDRGYRVYGLFLDARFGLLRWLPAAALAAAGAAGTHRRRAAVHAGALAICVALGSFVSITIMGWWFPGRMLVAALPSLAVLVALGVARLPRTGLVLAAWGWAVAAAVAWSAHHGGIRLAVDPWTVGAPLAPGALFPDFRSFGLAQVLASLAWGAALLALAIGTTRARRSIDAAPAAGSDVEAAA